MTETTGTHRMYYVALLCPAAIDQDVLRFKQSLREQFGCRAALKSPAHITLVAPFWFGEEREHELLEAVKAFHSDMPGIGIQLDGFSHFNRRVLFIAVKENAALTELQSQVQDHFTRFYPREIRTDNRAFHPHVTLATRDLYPAHWEKAWTQFEGKKYAENFTSRSLCLLKLKEGRWLPIAECDWTKSMD